MSKISKIRIEHFLNTKIKTNLMYSFEEGEDGKPFKPQIIYPVYVLVTYKRQTTQMKSVIPAGCETIEEAVSIRSELAQAEINMIKHIITEHYEKLEDDFTLKGFSELCKKYHRLLFDTFSDSYVWLDYINVVTEIGGEFTGALNYRNFRISAATQYKVAIKLLDNHPKLKQLEDRFKNLELFETLINNGFNLRNAQIIEWVFGKAKEQFSIAALQKGMKFDKVIELIKVIDHEVNNKI